VQFSVKIFYIQSTFKQFALTFLFNIAHQIIKKVKLAYPIHQVKINDFYTERTREFELFIIH